MSKLSLAELTVKFEKLFGYTFKNASLLELAFTHRSYAKQNNERLEFLGDSILNCTIAAELYSKYPNVPEGDLSRLRSSLVDKDTLANLARERDIGQYILLGGGELKTGGWRRDSILADAMEAIFGAVYLDSGVVVAQSFIMRVYHKALSDVPDVAELKDPKTRLQEYLQAEKLPIPTYSIVSVSGKSHDQQFTVECSVAEYKITQQAMGTSRRKAEQAAAKRVLSQLMNQQTNQ